MTTIRAVNRNHFYFLDVFIAVTRIKGLLMFEGFVWGNTIFKIYEAYILWVRYNSLIRPGNKTIYRRS